MEENSAEAVEPSNEVNPQNNPSEITDFPQTLVTEKIIFCVDIVLVTQCVEEEPLASIIFQLLKTYFNLKKKICVKPPEFEFFLIVHSERLLHYFINSAKDLQTAISSIRNINFEEEDGPLELDKIFQTFAEVVEIPDPNCNQKCLPPPRVYHVIWLFGRNLHVPTMTDTNPFDFLMMTPYFALDILYIYDNSSESSCCEQISQALLGLNENGKGYFLTVPYTNKRKMFSSLAQFLGHPLIRFPQIRAKFDIAKLGPPVEIVEKVEKDDEKDHLE